ncbi:HNH endonuclease, partial [Gordonia alkanivorans]|nr:HNH endonuclease [Gordonia alkanivorans]
MTVLTGISTTDVGPSTRPSELVQELHRITAELQAVDLAQCSDAELIDVAAGTERAIARLTFAGDRQIIEIA